MAEIRWTAEAAVWLKAIFDYIAADDEETARRTVKDIYDKVLDLAIFSKRGHLLHTTPEGELRVVLHSHYRIAYLVKNDGPIVVLGIFHGALDIDRYL